MNWRSTCVKNPQKQASDPSLSLRIDASPNGRIQALVDDLSEPADDFDFHYDPRLAARKAQYALTIGSPKDVARSKRQYVGRQCECSHGQGHRASDRNASAGIDRKVLLVGNQSLAARLARSLDLTAWIG